MKELNDLKDITDFKDLTSFLYNEYEKLSESFGIQLAPEELINFTVKSLKKYYELFDGPLYRSIQRTVKLREAIETMPHGFIWKFFHYDLWKRVKHELGLDIKDKKEKSVKEEKQSKSKEKENTLLPAVVEKFITPVVEEDNEN